MPRVVALYRYPVKGFKAEACESLAVLQEGRIAGDRALGFRFADAPVQDESWCRKHSFVALVNTPGLAALQLKFDPASLRLRISGDGLALEETLDDAGRRRLADALADYVQGLPVNPLSGHPGRLPLRLVGNGVQPRYQDDPAGQVTLHSRESVAVVATAFGEPDFSELRFRSNIAIEGVAPWEEQSWVGRSIRIGAVTFDVAKPKTRCLATHANPATGERDLDVMPALNRIYPQEKPTFAIAMATRGAGGTIRVGDAVVPQTKITAD